MRLLLVLALLLALAPAWADRYVRVGGTGSTCNAGWTTACGTLSQAESVVTRGETIWVATGTYTESSPTFDAPVNGTQVITIRKASPTQHGSETGWLPAYGVGQANFVNAGFLFVSDYWVVDGAYRNESQWNDGPSYGIKILSTFTSTSAFGVAADNVTIQYIDIGADYGSTNQASYGDGLYFAGFSETVTNWTVRRSYVHNTRTLAQSAGVHNFLWEYNFFGPNFEKTGIRHQVRGSSVTFRFNIFKNACQGNSFDPSSGNGCTSIIGWYGNVTGGENYTNSAVYGNVFIDTIGTTFYSDGVIFMGNMLTLPDDCTGCKIFNNTFVGHGRNNPSAKIILHFIGVKTNTEARNNLFYDNGAATIGCEAAVCSNNVTLPFSAGSDNAFVNRAADNFRLVANGGVGTGIALIAPYTTDMDGLVRGADGLWDVGAYEADDTNPPSAPSNFRLLNIALWVLLGAGILPSVLPRVQQGGYA